MRVLITVLMALMLGTGFAGVKSELAIGYKIVKDTVDGSVDPGKCLIKGVALKDGNVIKNALVYAQHTRAVKTNDKGEFQILLDTADQYLTVTKGDNYQGYIEGYKFKGGHEITCEVYIYDLNEIMIVDKPVIYMYSEKEIAVEVILHTDMELTFTYPLISETNKWETKINKHGISFSDGRSYPYLFWEAKTNNISYRRHEETVMADVLNTDTLLNYLENKLDDFGLNAVEKTDFITYWGPKMIRYQYVITQFNFDEVIEKMAALEISPSPDNQRRIFMLFTGFDNYPTIEVSAPNSSDRAFEFERGGFTVLEWGGTEVSREKLYRTL